MTDYISLANKVLQDEEITQDEALTLLQTSDENVLELINAAYQIRRRHFGNTVTIQMLFNAKSGACIEDCHYCSQSSISTAPIDRYALVEPKEMLEAARRAAKSKARRPPKRYAPRISRNGCQPANIKIASPIHPRPLVIKLVKVCEVPSERKAPPRPTKLPPRET